MDEFGQVLPFLSLDYNWIITKNKNVSDDEVKTFILNKRTYWSDAYHVSIASMPLSIGFNNLSNYKNSDFRKFVPRSRKSFSERNKRWRWQYCNPTCKRKTCRWASFHNDVGSTKDNVWKAQFYAWKIQFTIQFTIVAFATNFDFLISTFWLFHFITWLRWDYQNQCYTWKKLFRVFFCRKSSIVYFVFSI